MAFTQPLSLPHTTNPIHLYKNSYKPTLNIFPSFTKTRFPSLKLRALPDAEQAIFDVISNFDSSNGKFLPAVRTYDNDLARLIVVGAVDFEQALTAAAADGGKVAAEHIQSGVPMMVLESLYPGISDERSTVSTRLFLPAKEVEEKSRKLKSILTDDILSSTSSQNILSMTSRQVVLKQLSYFEVVIFRPGTERNMENLVKPREVLASFTLRSSDELPVSVLAEVVCLAALESTERHFRGHSLGRGFGNFLGFFWEPARISSKDTSIIIHKLLEDELGRNSKSLLENFNFKTANYKLTGTNSNYSWWTLSVFSELTKIGGPEFATWVSEFVPAYKLLIDTNKFMDIKFEGCTVTSDNWCEIFLNHSQMVSLLSLVDVMSLSELSTYMLKKASTEVGLANILDMYYEDLYTLPHKQLLCRAITKSTSASMSKRHLSFLKILSTVLVSAVALFTISTMGLFDLPRVRNGRKYHHDTQSLQASDTKFINEQYVEATKLGAFAITIISIVKDTYGWPGEIMNRGDGFAWTGELPEYLRSMLEDNSSGLDNTSAAISPGNIGDDMKALAQNIASYQVVVSADGEILQVQPTGSVAVDHWETNPLAQELYGGRKLSPGFLEPESNIIDQTQVVIDLLMSANSSPHFALARPAKL